MIPLEEAQAHVLGSCARLEQRNMPIDDAVGCVTAEPVVATEAVPPFPNTAMDGYAVQARDTEGASPDRPVRLAVTGTLAAGAAPDRPVGPGKALRIMTGAPFPPGADAVVIVEVTSTDGEDVLVLQPAKPGDHVRPAGEDIAPGQEVFPAGTVLTPAHVGVLASLGWKKVPVYGRARVGVLSTGDELVEGAGVLQPGQIRDSNRHTLLALLRQSGFDAVDLGIGKDDEEQLRGVIRRAVTSCDALITSGGVSMGEFDYVKKVLDDLGQMAWMQVAIRPAKPLAFGLVAGKPVFGLPGNPVSSMVSFELFARPALRQMMGFGSADLLRPRVWAVADGPLDRWPDGKLHLSRVVAAYGPDRRYHVHSSGGQASHQLKAMALANALALIPDGKGVAGGEEVEVLLLA